MGRIFSRDVAFPIVSFICGIITSRLLEQYLKRHDVTLLALEATLILLVALINLVYFNIRANQNALGETRKGIEFLANSSGLRVEFIEDGPTGESYRRAAQLIGEARKSLTFVDLWEPYDRYQTKNEDRYQTRKMFYEAILSQVERHLGDNHLFHRRVVQVPRSYKEGRVPFHVDPPFRDYLAKVSAYQEEFYGSCSIRIVHNHLFRTHFIIIDKRYIIMPLLRTSDDFKRQVRHGALIFDDRSGELFECLRGIYRAIDSHAQPLTKSDLGRDLEENKH